MTTYPDAQAVLRAFFAAVVLLVASTPSAKADSATASQSEPAGYRAAVDDARRELEAHNFAEARSLFARAYELYPTARALRGLGMAEFELRNYKDCVDTLQQALEAPVQRLDGDLRAQTEGLLTRARSFLSGVNIVVQPANASIKVDGADLPATQANPVSLQVGDHVLTFTAQGYSEERRALKVRGGEELSLLVTLRPVTPEDRSAHFEVKQPAPPPIEHDERRPLYKNAWLWTGVGVVVAGTATALAIALRPKEHRVYGKDVATLQGP